MRRRERIAIGCCAITLGFAGLALGGAVRWAALGASFAAIATAIPFARSRRTATTRSPLLVLLAIAIGLTALQLVPLPHGLADVLAHDKLEVVSDNAVAWTDPPPATVMASFDPPATLVELAKLVGYAALAFAALRLSSERTTRRALAAIVVGAAVAVALVALAHAAVGATTIYGVFVPPNRVSPIINDNHFASLMAMAVPVALGLAVTATRGPRAMWIGAALLCAVSCLLISSRGGAIGLVIGLFVVTVLMLLQRRTATADRPRHRGLSIPALVIGGCTLILVGALAAGQVAHELSATKLETLTSDPHWKVQGWSHALEMLEDHPWLGTGRGAFEPAYTRWAPVGDLGYSHVENTYVQIAVDWGIPGAVAIALATIALAIAAARRWNQTPLEAAALAALASLAAHDFVDFSLELPVVAMTTILLIAILLPVRLDDGKRPRRHTPWVRGALLTLAAATCATAATPLGQLAHPAAAQLAAVAEPSERLALAIDAVDHHPADYLLMGRAAQTLMDLGDPRALAVISRALVLDPQHAGLHRLAATMLLRAKQPAQAQVELALAVQFAPYTMLQELVDEIAATFPDAEDAARAFPFEPSAFPRLQNFIIPHKDLAFAYSRRLAYLNPSDFSAQLLYAHAALTIGRADLALPAARGAFALRATTESAIALATARARNSDTAGSIVMLRESLARGIATTPGERVQLLSSIADLELASGSLGPAAATLDELAQLVTDQGERVALHLRRADLHDRRSEPNLAKWERAQATKLQAGGL